MQKFSLIFSTSQCDLFTYVGNLHKYEKIRCRTLSAMYTRLEWYLCMRFPRPPTESVCAVISWGNHVHISYEIILCWVNSEWSKTTPRQTKHFNNIEVHSNTKKAKFRHFSRFFFFFALPCSWTSYLRPVLKTLMRLSVSWAPDIIIKTWLFTLCCNHRNLLPRCISIKWRNNKNLVHTKRFRHRRCDAKQSGWRSNLRLSAASVCSRFSNLTSKRSARF